MNWLDKVQAMRAGVNSQNMPTTLPTKTTETLFVVSVSTYPGHISEKMDAANDPAPDPDPDRHCWPLSSAWNTMEMAKFTARLELFTRRGMPEADAELLADKLVLRDRGDDDRRLCLECNHIKHSGDLWACHQWRRAGLSAAGLPAELVRLLQRCNGFQEATR